MLHASMIEMWASMASTIASFLFVWAMICQYSPYEIRRRVDKFRQRLQNYLNPYVRISFHEFTGKYQPRSQAYDVVEAYLSRNNIKGEKRLRAEMRRKDNTLVLSLNDNEAVPYEFMGARVWWLLCGKMWMTRGRTTV
ncbi:hypothetical protein L484_008952 [Morus notabilis]|uniref:AAA-type ATPase N-terminal domain-containing protein n=1 Tax=Morus notabilis TaxID=981085 RepID=W9QL89_9ROSA|nr:hypothetical protein L484_008952 [Morus notabilis]